LVIASALALAGCKDGTQFTVHASFDLVLQRLQGQLASVPVWKNLQVVHTYTNRAGFTYLDDSDPAAVHRVTIAVEGRNQYETAVTIRGERKEHAAGSTSFRRDPDFEQQMQQKLFPALQPGS
jgi:hypothetical protein